MLLAGCAIKQGGPAFRTFAALDNGFAGTAIGQGFIFNANVVEEATGRIEHAAIDVIRQLVGLAAEGGGIGAVAQNIGHFGQVFVVAVHVAGLIHRLLQ
ncbi:hypothetical protein D3C73_1404790 [compost metagenome]